ncbi:CPBP family intramembrane metalloprotease [soil metagenome]
MNYKKTIFDFLPFVLGSVLTYITVYLIAPALSLKFEIMELGAWMISAPLTIFIPLVIIGMILIKSEKNGTRLFERTRFKKLTKFDWRWIGIGLLGMTILSGLTFFLTGLLNLNPNPPFSRQVEPWLNGHQWMFIAWIIYWPINILGEGFIWRGVLQPRLEKTFKQNTWIISAVLWGVFHLAFGLGNLIVLVPTLIFVPYVTQKTQNTWTGIILHATLSGPGFIVLAFGLMNK